MTDREKSDLAQNIANHILQTAEDLCEETKMEYEGNVLGLLEALANGAVEMQFRTHNGVQQSRFRITRHGAGMLHELLVERANATEH